MKILDKKEIDNIQIYQGRIRHDYSKEEFKNCKVLYPINQTTKNNNRYYLCQCNCGNYFLASSYNFRDNPLLQCDECRIGVKIGDIFGRLTVIKQLENSSQSKRQFLCECSCERHKQVIVTTDRLKSGKTKSCGCLNIEANTINLVGKQFGYLTVIERANKIGENNGKPKWRCICNGKCGGTETIVFGENLRYGKSLSCGCMNSKGEAKICQLLNENNIKYEVQKTFDTCRNPNTLSLLKFDFYLPEYNYLIEYDGEQHSKPRDSGWNTKENLQNVKERDNIKNQWCKENNISLIRIPYTHFKDLCIEDLLLNKTTFLYKEINKNNEI